MKLLSTLGDNVNTFVISHKGDALNEQFENVVRFEKINNFSKVV